MNGAQFTANLARELNVSIREASVIVKTFLDSLVAIVAIEWKVSFRNYAVFSKKSVWPKLWVDPRDPTKRVQYKWFNKLSVKWGKNFKKFLNSN